MEAEFIKLVISQAPTVGVLLFIVYKQEQRLDSVLRRLMRCLDKIEGTDKGEAQ